MKIGILTITPNIGYGGIMQALALYNTLTNEGHEVILINRKQKYPLWRQILIISKRIINKYLNKKDIALTVQQEYSVISEKTEQFISKHIKRTSDIIDEKGMVALNQKGFNAFIVGSDQVWRPQYVPNIYNYFFDFVDNNSNIKKIVYAASFGTDKWEFSQKETSKCCGLIKKIDHVSVREDSAVTLCKEYFNISPNWVLDPTLLLDKQDYSHLINGNEIQPNLFTYILDMNEEKRSMISKIQNKLDIELTEFNTNAENKNAPLKNRVAPPVEEWIAGFKNAEYIITDSFHGCVFSIIFNKPFLVYGNKDRGLSRFSSLLKMLGLDNRLITSIHELSEGKITENINWDPINEILKKRKEDSLSFLKQALYQ